MSVFHILCAHLCSMKHVPEKKPHYSTSWSWTWPAGPLSSLQEMKMSAVIKFILLSAYQCCFEPWVLELLSVLGMWESRLSLSQCLGMLLGLVSVKLCLWAETSSFFILSQKEQCFPGLRTRPAADCISVDSAYHIKGFTLHCLVPAEVRSCNLWLYLGVIFVWFHCS